MKPPSEQLQRMQAGGQRWRQLNTFVDTLMATLTPAAALTWVAMFRLAKPDGRVKVPQTWIGRKIGRSVRAVRDAQRELERLGLLTVVRRGRLNVGPSIFVLHATPHPEPSGGS